LVNQTGKMVVPNPYIVVGTSWAIQHQIGMKEPLMIIASNTNEETSIFQVVDYRCVSNTIQFHPRLLGESTKASSGQVI
jgi:electron transfer flavoprotein alpha subunit